MVKKSKTEAILIPSTNKIKEWRQQKRLESGINTAGATESGVAKKKTAQTNIAKTHNSAPETRNTMLENDGHTSFAPKIRVSWFKF